MLRGKPAAVHLDRLRRDEARETLQHFDLVVRQPLLVAGIQPADIFVARLLELGPAELAELGSEAVAQRVFHRVREIGGGPHDFFGYASHVYTGAAHPPGFDQGHARTVACRAVGGGNAAAAAADHE